MSDKRLQIIIASSNTGKIAEIKAVFQQDAIKWLTHEDYEDWPEIVEDETTFEGNATKKAVTMASYFNKAALADDSGLEVDALNGAPGVVSARYSGADATAEKNNTLLIRELTGVAYEDRTARFRCAMALAFPDGTILRSEGSVDGHIVVTPAGDKGFGYDPLFIPAGFDRTMAELSLEEKNRISHRGKALAEMKELILQHMM